MRVFTRIVMDMGTGAVLESEGHEHAGPVALCKGGGSSTTNTQDTVYNARMATIAEDQQGMAKEYYGFWKSDYKPLEAEQIQANREMIAAAKPVREKFISESLSGVNPEAIAAQARADAEQAVTGAEASTSRGLARYGLNPDGGAFQDSLGRVATTNRARAVVQSVNSSRTAARTENFNRLAAAAGLGLG